MEAPTVSMAAEATTALLEETPRRLEDEEFERLAFELWQHASCPETENDPALDPEEEEVYCHSSCL